MPMSLSTARFAAILAVAAIIFSAGLVSGAAGDPLILGSSTNAAGAAGTKLTSSVNGNAFAVSQNGVGASANGLRGDANTGTGGVFTSSSNNALFATAASGNRFGMVAVSNGGAGTGGAMLAVGNANPGLTVDVDSNFVAPLEVNSTAHVANLNSDLVDGYHASSLQRVAFASTEDATAGTLLTASITAPTRGWFHIVSSVDAWTATSGTFTCQLNVDDNYVAGSLRIVALGTDNLDEDCSTNGTYKTCGGASSVTFTTSGAVNTSFDSASMHVVFSPFDGAGNAPPLLGCLVIGLDAPSRDHSAD